MKVVINTIDRLSQIVRENPSLLNTGPLSSLRSYINKLSTPGCCSEKDNEEYRKQLDLALKSMTTASAIALKKALGADELSWYAKDANGRAQQKTV